MASTVIASTIDRFQFAVTIDKTHVTLSIPGSEDILLKPDDARAVGAALTKGANAISKPAERKSRKKKGPHTETV